MESTGAQFISRTKDVFLAEPLSVDGRKALHNIGIAMTEDELYTDVYVEPFSEYKKRKMENVSSHDEPDTSSYYDEIDTNILHNTESTFRTKLKNLSESMFIIKGIAGSGKTTYLHKIKRLLSDSIQFHIHNFEEVKQSVSFLSDSIDLKSLFSSNVYKFISSLLGEISEVLWKGEKSTDEHRDYIKNIVGNYDKYLHVTEEILPSSPLNRPNADIDEQQGLFNILRKYAMKETDYNTLSNQLIKHIKARLISGETDNCADLAFVSGFLIRLGTVK